MNIAPQRVVTLHYVLSDEQGRVIDDSRARAKPLEFLYGHDNIMPGLEQVLTGHEAGARLSVTLPPEQAYGTRSESLFQNVSRGAFPQAGLEPGMRFQTPGDDGPQIVTVLEVHDESVLIDTNHPLAGQTLSYALEVLDVRGATRAELAKGHPLPADVTPSQVEDRKLP